MTSTRSIGHAALMSVDEAGEVAVVVDAAVVEVAARGIGVPVLVAHRVDEAVGREHERRAVVDERLRTEVRLLDEAGGAVAVQHDDERILLALGKARRAPGDRPADRRRTSSGAVIAAATRGEQDEWQWRGTSRERRSHRSPRHANLGVTPLRPPIRTAPTRQVVAAALALVVLGAIGAVKAGLLGARLHVRPRADDARAREGRAVPCPTRTRRGSRAACSS